MSPVPIRSVPREALVARDPSPLDDRDCTHLGGRDSPRPTSARLAPPRTMRIVYVLVLMLTASGCFAQSGAMAENCAALRSLWSEAQADMRVVVADGRLDPQAKSEKLIALADRLRKESGSIEDGQLRAAMRAVASDITTMAEALGGVGTGGALPPATSIKKLNKAMGERCPV